MFSKIMLPTFISKFIYRLGTKARNPSLDEIYKDLKKSEKYSFKQLQDLQFERTKYLLQFSQNHSPYYRKLFANAGFDPSSALSLEDIKSIPVTDKKTLLAECSQIHTDFTFSKTFKAETSGTSGNALEFSKNEAWDSTNRATMMRAYDWYGVDPWDYNGYLWGFNISGLQEKKVKLLDYLQNRIRIFSYRDSEIEQFSRRIRSASFLSGYSSMIYEIAKAINKKQVFTPKDFTRLKMIKGTSEMILDIYKAEVKQAFGLNIISEYGAAEAGLIAFECPQGKLHINVENVILETNENNEAIITNLASFSFPIIRYNLGDIVELDETNSICECGLAHPTIKSLSGRKGASIHGNDGQYPALTFYYVFKNLAIQKKLFLNYRAFQSQVGEVLLKIEQPYSEYSEQQLKLQLQSYFGDDLSVEVQWSANLDTNRDRKVQYFNTSLE
jgi:phenylacetate-CoA ligase